MKAKTSLGRRLAAVFVVGLAIALVVLPAPRVGACTCAGFQDPRDRLQEADAAIIGTFVGQRPADPDDQYGDTIYTFAVDEEVKGDFGETLDVRSASDGAACGLSVSEGRQEGLFLYDGKGDGTYSSGLCSQIDPDELREAATPLPAPTGEPPVRFLAGGSFGDARTLSADRRGHTIAYGLGDEDFPEAETLFVSVCPEGRRVAEIATAYPGAWRLAVRRVGDLSLVREFELPFGKRPLRRQDVVAVACRNRLGSSVVVATSNDGYRRVTGYLARVEGERPSLFHESDFRRATFTRRHAYLIEGTKGRRLVRVDLATGSETLVARLPARVSALAASPDGRKLAGIAFGGYAQDSPPSRAVLVRVRSGRVVTRSLGRSEAIGEMEWKGPRRVAFLSEGRAASRLFDASLRVVSRMPGWVAWDSTISGEFLYGFSPGYDCLCAEVHRRHLPDGRIRKLTELPSPQVYLIEAVR